MIGYRNPKFTAVVCAVGLASQLVLIFTVDEIWPWMRITLIGIALLLALKATVAWRADRPDVSDFEKTLRRRAFVEREL